MARKVVAGEHKGFLALDHKPSWLHVEGLHDLKHKTGAVVVMVREARRRRHRRLGSHCGRAPGRRRR